MSRLSTTRRLLRILRLGVQLSYLQLRGDQRRFSRTLFAAMFELGGVYIKFLQALLIHSDVLTDQSLLNQLRLYEAVDSEPIDIQTVLQAELGTRWQEHIGTVETASFAAGSFGQVYRAQLAAGQEVVIKVLRPSLYQELPFDLRLMGIVARTLSWIKPSGMMDIMAIYREFRDVTRDETDYLREVGFALEMHERYRDHPIITIPYTYQQLCTPSIIVQDYIGGLSIARLLATTSAGGLEPFEYVREHLQSDLDFQLREVGYQMLHDIFVHPTTQGDPHPGNIKLLPNNRVGLIDFGLIAEAPRDRVGLLKMMKEHAKMHAGIYDVRGFSLMFLELFASKLVRSIDLLAMAAQNPAKTHHIMEEVARSAEAVLASSRGADAQRLFENGHFVIAFNQVINENNRLGLRVQFDATTLIRCAQMFLNLTRALGRKETVFLQMYQRVIDDVEAQQLATVNASAPPPLNLEQAIEVIGDWLDRVAVSDPFLFDKVSTHLTRRSYV